MEWHTPYRPLRGFLLIAVAVMTVGWTAAVRADTLLLQQVLPAGTAGAPFLLLDRTRISHVAVSKDTGQEHRLTVHLATEPPAELSFTCNDEAITRQVLDSLRRGAAATLDVTGRCRL